MPDKILNAMAAALVALAIVMAVSTVWFIQNYTIVDDSLGSTEHVLCNDRHCFEFHDKTLRQKYDWE